MDFYVDLAVAVLLRLIKDRRSVRKYFPALAKVHRAISALAQSEAELRNLIERSEVGP